MRAQPTGAAQGAFLIRIRPEQNVWKRLFKIVSESEVAQWLACWAHNPKVPGSKPGAAMHALMQHWPVPCATQPIPHSLFHIAQPVFVGTCAIFTELFQEEKAQTTTEEGAEPRKQEKERRTEEKKEPKERKNNKRKEKGTHRRTEAEKSNKTKEKTQKKSKREQNQGKGNKTRTDKETSNKTKEKGTKNDRKQRQKGQNKGKRNRRCR